MSRHNLYGWLALLAGVSLFSTVNGFMIAGSLLILSGLVITVFYHLWPRG